MQNKIKKIILDTNILISYLIGKSFVKLDKYIFNNQTVLLFSEELLNEFINVIQRPKLKKYFSKNDINNILNYFNKYGKLINITSNVNICRDIKDNFLLDLAIDGKADLLITGDEDLLILKEINNTKIISFRYFIDNIDFLLGK